MTFEFNGFTRMSFVTMTGFLLINCAGPAKNRINYDDSKLTHEENCDLFIAKHKEYQGSNPPIGRLQVFDKGYSSNCSEDQVEEIIRSEGCRLGAKVAQLKNIVEPSYFGSTCFQTEAEFYDDDPAKFSLDKKQYLAIDTLKNSGFRIGASVGAGALTGGDQTRNGVIWINQANNDTVESVVDQAGFGFLLGYGFGEHFLLDAGYSVRFVTNRPKGGNSKNKLKLFTKNYMTLDPQVILFHKDLPFGKFGIQSGVELRYVWFQLDPEFKTFLREKVLITPYETTASGFGWTGKLGMELLRNNGLFSKINLGYGNESPSFDGARALDAWDFGVEFQLGYKFKH